MNVLESLRAEVDRVGGFLDALSGEDWRRATRCAPMSVHDLAAHMKRGATRITDMLDGGPLQVEPEVDGETYWWRPRENAAEEGAQIVARAQEEAAKVSAQALPDAWKHDWDAAFAAAEPAMSEDAVYGNPFGIIRLSEYLRTRHIEAVVHHMDLRDALGLAPDPEPEALAVVCGVLAGLLGTDPRRFGMDDVRFALVGTGRALLSAGEEAALGSLAGEFPLIW